ncbi:MAG: hypothetical protein V2J07_00545 [Anaerolineae bacterium]|jgi:uncharacterized membrane protein|nr:hypothetical protein [Anaerolineae bacterium]
MSELNRKRQYDLETTLRWVVGSIFWTLSIGFVVMLANQFWTTIKVISREAVIRSSIESVVTAQGQVNFIDRMSLYLLMFVVAALVVYLFFKYIDPGRQDEEIFLIEDHPYFKKSWFERIELMRILKLFIITTLIGFGVYLLLSVSVLLVAALN